MAIAWKLLQIAWGKIASLAVWADRVEVLSIGITLIMIAATVFAGWLVMRTRIWLSPKRTAGWFLVMEIVSAGAIGVHALQGAIGALEQGAEAQSLLLGLV